MLPKILYFKFILISFTCWKNIETHEQEDRFEFDDTKHRKFSASIFFHVTNR